MNSELKSTKAGMKSFQKKELILQNDFASLDKSVQKNSEVVAQNTKQVATLKEDVQEIQANEDSNEQKVNAMQAKVEGLQENENKKFTADESKL